MTELLDAVRSHRHAHRAAILREFVDLLALPNVSRDLDDVRANAVAIAELLRKRDVEVEVLDLPGAAPVVSGRLDVGAERTIGIYAHYDGQPVEPAEWTHPPFQPTLCAAGSPRPLPEDGEEIDDGWRLFARSAADDKAPVLALATALDGLAAARAVPAANVAILFEGEEEIGSPHLSEYLARHRDRFAADVWLICDGPVHPTGRPQVAFGVRGVTELEITVYGPARPVHSGHYGNWAPNPALELARLVATMKDADGGVLISGFYDDTALLTDGDLAAIAALPGDDDRQRHELALGATEAPGAALAERLMLPSLNLRGLAAGGVGDQAANVVPASATASFDIRLALGDDPVAMLDRVEEHVRAQGYHVVHDEPDAATRRGHQRVARVRRRPGYPAVRTPVASPVGDWALAAAAAAAGEPAVALPTFGGSVPLHSFVSELGAPVVITPFANHDNNQHAADENLRIGNLWYGVDLMAALLGAPPPA